MRLFALPLAALLIATPAAAQINGTRQASASQYERPVPVQADNGWREELRAVDRRIDDARERGEISRREARTLRRQARLVRATGARFAAGGLSDAEQEMLESQAFALRDLAQAPSRPVPARRGR
jgi:hypothetical protein